MQLVLLFRRILITQISHEKSLNFILLQSQALTPVLNFKIAGHSFNLKQFVST